jgi:hypothetical protein
MAQGTGHRVQGTGYKAKTIKEDLSSPYALRLAPYAFDLFCWQKLLNSDLHWKPSILSSSATT